MISWDFKEALLGTVKEKYESEYVKVIEIDGKNVKEYWTERDGPLGDAMIIYRLRRPIHGA